MEVIDTQFSMLSSSSAMLGEHPSIKKIYEIIQRVAATDVTVLITGESGTGKELVARAIHFRGTMAQTPFVAVDCGSLVPTLMESELFGYEKGAFTGAIKTKPASFKPPTAAQSSSMKLASYPSKCKPSSCASCKRRKFGL